MRKGLIAAVPLLFLVTGCAHYLSGPARATVDRRVTFGQLRKAPDAYRGKVVMLGGVIADVTPLAAGTRLEVVEHPLDSRELPIEVVPSGGRFLAVTRERLDPERYRPGVLVSMVGEVAGTQSGKGCDYPVIEVREIRDIVFEEMPNWGGPCGGD